MEKVTRTLKIIEFEIRRTSAVCIDQRFDGNLEIKSGLVIDKRLSPSVTGERLHKGSFCLNAPNLAITERLLDNPIKKYVVIQHPQINLGTEDEPRLETLIPSEIVNRIIITYEEKIVLTPE